MGVHHDNFDLWNSKYQPKWNAAQLGPKKDIVGRFRDATRREGLRFAVSDHLSNSFSWLATAHLSEKEGQRTRGKDKEERREKRDRTGWKKGRGGRKDGVRKIG
mgnify:CR=1 FL=1